MTDSRDLIKSITKQGGHVERGGQHLKLYGTDGHLVGILPAGRCHDGRRDFKNVVAQCRRAGFEL